MTAGLLCEQVKAVFQKCIDEYSAAAKGPSKLTLLLERLQDLLSALLRAGADIIDAKAISQQAELQAAIDDLRSKCTGLEAKLLEEQQTAKAAVVQLNAELDSAKAAADAEKTRLTELLQLKADELTRTAATVRTAGNVSTD